MWFRGSWVVLVLLIATAAHADDHRADVYGGLSWAEGSWLVGGHGSFSRPIPKVERKDFNIVLDVAVNSGSEAGSKLTRTTALAGARWSHGLRANKKHVLFAHALPGLVYSNTDGVEQGKDFAFGLGGGWEYFHKRKSEDSTTIPPTTVPNLLGIRVQVDYVFRSDDAENFTRVSVGVIYRFNKEK